MITKLKFRYYKHSIVSIFVLLLLLTCTLKSNAGYRHVKREEVNDQNKPADVTVNRVSSSQWSEMNIVDIDADNQIGKSILKSSNKPILFNTINVQPGQKLQITLKKPTLSPDSSIFAYTVHGGRINGKVATSLKVKNDGSITFIFTVGRWLGNYPLIIRHAGREDVLEFWVRDEEGKK